MLRSIVCLAAQHWREHWLRDMLYLLTVATVTVLLYAGNLSGLGSVSGSYLVTQLDNIRYGIILWWITITTVYTLFTAFHGYGNTRRCYATLLLPACREAKYLYVWIHTMFLFPFAALVVIWGIDTLAVECMLNTRPMLTDTFNDIGSLWNVVIATNEPLNYIPYNIYLVVWFNAVAMLVRSGLRPAVAVATILVALAMTLMFPWSSEGATLYPFVWLKMSRDYAVTWSMPMSWCSRIIGYTISYVWYAALPFAVYILSYLKFKERDI